MAGTGRPAKALGSAGKPLIRLLKPGRTARWHDRWESGLEIGFVEVALAAGGNQSVAH